MQDRHDHDHALPELQRPNLSSRPYRAELQRFVAAARAQTIAGTCVTAESVQAGLEHAGRRSHARRMLWLSGTIAVAASLLVMAVVAPLWSDSEPADVATNWLTGEQQLDDAVHMSSNGTSEIRDAWSVALGEGTHEVELEREPGHGDGPLRIELPDRTLELVEGRVTIEVVGHDAAVHLHTGIAAWIGADGQRTEIEVGIQIEQLDLDPADQPQGESAATLAREADRLLTADDREQAITTLRRLIETYPHASQARAAILDLARLLSATKRDSEARCAYELYLARWPDSSVKAEVEAQLAQLERGSECRGLDPN